MFKPILITFLKIVTFANSMDLPIPTKTLLLIIFNPPNTKPVAKILKLQEPRAYSAPKKVFNIKPKYIFFSGTTFFEDNIDKEKWIVKQTNIFPHHVYLYFFNLKKFVNLFTMNGYKLVSCKKNKFAKVDYKNFNPLLIKIRYLDVLFVKE